MSDAPVHQCLVSDDLWDRGMGYAVVSRRRDDRIVAACYLLDVWCLGVKNAFVTEVSARGFRDMLDKVGGLEPVEASYAARLVKSAAAYAASFGLSPHPDYRQAQTLLEGIDETACQETFTFGKDGEPFYISGPFDTPARTRDILRKIGSHSGFIVASLPQPETEDAMDILTGAQAF